MMQWIAVTLQPIITYLHDTSFESLSIEEQNICS
jgi:hypothetical protein